jgi:histidine triad (HIT) family protein
MASIFSKIIAGEAPAYKLWEDDEFLAFLDINPVNPGHTLLIPKIEIDYLFDLPEPLYQRAWQHVRWLSPKIRSAMQCRKIGVAVEGFSVAHAHIHLIPVNAHGELSPHRSRAASVSELLDTQQRILLEIEA